MHPILLEKCRRDSCVEQQDRPPFEVPRLTFGLQSLGDPVEGVSYLLLQQDRTRSLYLKAFPPNDQKKLIAVLLGRSPSNGMLGPNLRGQRSYGLFKLVLRMAILEGKHQKSGDRGSKCRSRALVEIYMIHLERAIANCRGHKSLDDGIPNGIILKCFVVLVLVPFCYLIFSNKLLTILQETYQRQ